MIFAIVVAVAWYAEAVQVERDWRIDLYTEAIISADDDKRAGWLANDLLPLRRRVAMPFHLRQYPKDLYGHVFAPRYPYQWHKGHDPFVADGSSGLVRAEHCTVENHSRGWFVVAVRNGVTERFKPTTMHCGEWYRAVVLVNGPLETYRVVQSLVICDGDVEISSGARDAVVIANGNIKWWGGQNSQLYATGKITTETEVGGKNNVLKENLTQLPFGVRFFDPKRDYGLEVEAAKGELTVKADCPALKLLKGDVLIKANGVVTDTAVKLREHLRRGAARGSVELVFRRGREWVTQTVELDGFPYPRAPMPREAGH